MADNVQLSTPVTPVVPSSTPPGGTPTAPAATAPAEPFKFGDTAPAWARGKSAEEVLGIAQQLVDAGLSVGGAAPAAQTPSHSPAPVATPTASPTYADDDYITGKDLRSILADAATKYVNPNAQASLDLAASANLGIARQQHAAEFQRFGPEIVRELAAIPKNLWTLDNLTRVVKFVKSDHIDELARERAQQLVSNVEPTIRSTGVVGSVPVPVNKESSLESDRIPAEWKERAARAGITEATVREFCVANEMTPESFYKQFETPRNAIVQETGKTR